MDVSTQAEHGFALPLSFCSVQALSRLDDAPAIGEGGLLTQSTGSNADLFLRHIPRTNVYQLPGHPSAQS